MNKIVITMFAVTLFLTAKGQNKHQKVFTSDIDNFWIAYDSCQTTTDSLKQLYFINSLYIDKGTKGLKAFMESRKYTAGRWVSLLKRYPRFWKSIRPNTLTVKSKAKEIERTIEKFKKIYPELKDAQMYFTIGGLRSGGTVMNGMVLIGTEIASGDAKTDVSEFPDKWLESVFKSQQSDNIVPLNVHEYVHTQQNGENENLLAQVIKEGSCEFITELVMGKPLESSHIVYGREHESALKEAFRKDMYSNDYSKWLYNGGDAEQMADLGYFMGYVICKAYYNKSGNKKQAIKDIIELNYASTQAVDDFMARSGYYTDYLQTANSHAALAILNTSIQQMGGEAFLKSINVLQVKGKQINFLIDQSIRPTAPFSTTVNNYTAIKLPQSNKLSYWVFYNQSAQVVKYVVDDSSYGVARGKSIGFMPYGSDLDEELYLSPEKVLLLAKENNPVFVGDTVVHLVPLKMVTFHWKNYPVRLFFNANSHYLFQVEITRHYTDNTAFTLGDAKMIHRYGFWKKEGKQLHYPAQKDIFLGDTHFKAITIDSVFINPSFDEAEATIADTTKAKIAKTFQAIDMFKNVPALTSQEVMPNIFFVKGRFTPVGSYNSWFFKTDDGVVIIEAPVTSAYSVGVLNEVKKRFPNEKIKAVITTSDAWPHFGGIREYAAQKIPIYLLDLNEPVVTRVLKANFSSNPDALQKNKSEAVLKKVSGKTVIQDKGNPIEIYPIKTETGERMMMVYFPKQKLLYTSDLVQPGFNGEKFFMPQYIGEIIEAINREKLQVEKIIGMHQSVIDYKELKEFIKSN